MSDSLAEKPRSLIAGISIVAGTAVGAGMFSMPVVSSGMWFSFSLALMLITWFCMYHSSLMILEANLNFAAGTSFDTFVKGILGPRWNTFNNLTLTFVLYILTYAYISGGGSIVSHTLESTLGTAPTPTPTVAGLIFALGLATIVWFSTGLVGRITGILIGGMLITFLLTLGNLGARVQSNILFDIQPSYAPFILAAVPYFLTSFGYHGNVPSLMKYYGHDPKRIRQCLLYGSLISLIVYSLWQLVTLGNIPREQFQSINAAGGNIGDLVAALEPIATIATIANSTALSGGLNAFANMAVVSSFLGVSLGLFDFIADKFKFDDSHLGRLKTATLTFLPPTIGGLFFPNGFLYAIGLAGLCAAVWGTIVPALCAKVSREKFGNPIYRVWGGNVLINVIIGYGVLLIVCYLLAALGLLPMY